MRTAIVCGIITGASEVHAIGQFPPVFNNSTRSLYEGYLVPVFISFLKWWMVGHVTQMLQLQFMMNAMTNLNSGKLSL